jgi:hypothetical protein
MTTETKFRAGIAMSLLGLIIMTFEFFEKDRIYNEYKVTSTHQMDSLQAISDSLRDELFIERVDGGRHEITREEVLGKYPKINKEYENFYLHQTE